MQSKIRQDLVAVIDPDGVSQQTMLRALRELDCRVVGFASTSLAMAHVLQRRFDVVIDAQQGARFEGRSFGGALRARLGSACPTLVLARSAANDAREARDYDIVLATPIAVVELVAALDHASLARRGVAS